MMQKNLPVTYIIRQAVPDILHFVRSNSLGLNFISVVCLDVINQAYVMKKSQQTLMFPEWLHQWYSAIQLQGNFQPSSPRNSTCILYSPDAGIQTWSFSPAAAAKAVQDKVNLKRTSWKVGAEEPAQILHPANRSTPCSQPRQQLMTLDHGTANLRCGLVCLARSKIPGSIPVGKKWWN